MSKLIKCETNPQHDPYSDGSTYTVLKIYKDGYALMQEFDDTATPVEEANRLVLHLIITERPDQAAARAYLESAEALSLVERIYAGWDRHLVGTLTKDAEDAIEELRAGINGLPENQMSLWSGEDWLGNLNDREIGISALTTDAEIAALAEKLEADALDQGKVILYGTEEYLVKRRNLAAE